MRIHTQKTEPFIHALALSVERDPASLEGWRCLHVLCPKNQDSEWYGTILTHLQQSNQDLDCEVICCPDDDVLFLSRTVALEGLYALAHMFINAASLSGAEASEVALYDLYHDYLKVRDLLKAKARTRASAPEDAPVEKQEPRHFGEVASLADVFGEAKKLRKARMPLRVMLVEDDSLTRRIVANAFKQNYALISAANAQEAVENYLLHAPDIVFLDIGLPDASGFDVLQQIMATDPNAYVVMFSSNGYLDNVTHALTQGASGFISKPFKQEKLRRYIQESASHHQKHCA